MTVSYDLSTLVGKVRLIISDKNINNAVFTDEEITYFLTENSNNINLAAASALDSWAASYATNADSEKIGDYAYTQGITKKMTDLAASLRAKDASAPVIDWAELDFDKSLEGE